MLQSILLPDSLTGRSFHGDHGPVLCRMAIKSRCFAADFDSRPAGRVERRLPLPGKLWRLLFHLHPQPLLASCSDRSQGSPDRSAAEAEPPDRFAAAKTFLQGNYPVRPSSHGRSYLRQAAAALRGIDRGVYPQPSLCQPLRLARFHRTHLEGPGLQGGLISLSRQVWAGPSQPCRCRPSRGSTDRSRRGSRVGPRPAAGQPRDCSRRAGARTASPFFSATTQYAGAFLLLPQALNWLTIAQDCFADDYGSLQQGLLTSVFNLVIGLERVFHLDEMEDVGFARLCGGEQCPTRQRVGAWRRHLPWYEVETFCRGTCPWHLVQCP